MKCKLIRLLSDSQAKTDASPEDFATSEMGKCPFGKLFVAMVTEPMWMEEYTVGAYFQENLSGKYYLIVEHPRFLPGQSQVTIPDDGTEWTLKMVEEKMKNHLTASKRSLQPGISALKGLQEGVQRMIDQIDRDKAYAAIVSVYPEAAATEMARQTPSSDLHVFCAEREAEPIFVVRKIDGEFVGGVARIGFSLRAWQGLDDGTGPNQKHGRFFLELARAFASRKLEIPEDELLVRKISAWRGQTDGKYYVTYVSFFTKEDTPNKKRTVFFEGGLPEEIKMQGAEDAPSE